MEDPVARTLEQVTQVDGRVRALVEETDLHGRFSRAAEELEARFPNPEARPPLFGMPLGVKDIINVDGLPTRAGSTLPAAEFGGPEATAVRRLRDAGALVLGKTTTTEFAFSEPTPTANPRAPGHTPGGSSSGSAAAVAAEMTPLALGTQTVDSIVTPAAYCGVVGFKPTYGRVPIDGVVPFAPSMDTIGVLSRDVAGTAAAARIMSDDWQSPSRKVSAVLGIPASQYLAKVDREALRSFEGTCDRLRIAGWELVPTDVLEDIDGISARHRRLIAREFADQHRTWFAKYRQRYRPRTAALIQEGSALDRDVVPVGVASAERLRQEIHDHMDPLSIEAWITPAAVGPAPVGLEFIGDPIMSVPWTHARLPVLALPAGSTAEGLPLGIQLVGRSDADEDLLALAESVESVLHT